MTRTILNLFFKFSGILFNTKRKLVSTNSWVKAFPIILLVIVLELLFFIITFPIYLIISPKKIQERGFIFSINEKTKKKNSLNTYKIRRKISLIAGLGVFSFTLLKVLLLTLTSFYLLGAQTLLAATTAWAFDTSGNYTYDSAKIEVVGGEAKLKNTTSTTSENTLNQDFDIDSSNWSFSEWLTVGGVTHTGSHVAIGGNPNGYINININSKKNNTLAGYWEQSFTTTGNNLDTATLDLDWIVDVFNPTGVSNMHLYAFIDSSSGNPTIGQEVWDSNTISTTTSWASISQIDVLSSVATAGTYYLKIAVWVNYASISGVGDQTIGFDNVAINWSKLLSGYPTDKPIIEPITSLQTIGMSNYDSFTETATKNSGEIYYQLSDDDGSTWQYWNGSAWEIAGASDYNTSSIIDTSISNFSTSTGKIMWKAFLESNGTQQIILSDLEISYTGNDLPDVSDISAAQSVTSSLIYIDYALSDDESDPSNLVDYEYSLTGDFVGEESSMTASTTDASHDGILSLDTSPTGTSHIFVWDAKVDIGDIYSNTIYIRLRANDIVGDGPHALSSAFEIDYAAPLGLSSFSKFSSTENSAVFNWSSGITDANFDYFEIWYGNNMDDVNNRTSTAIEWGNDDDSNLLDINTISTSITGLNIGDYYAKIYAIDIFNNESSLDSIAFTISFIEIPEPEPTTPYGGGGSSFFAQDTKPPKKPIINELDSPTPETAIIISGSAEPRSRIDLYNHGKFIERLKTTTNNNGIFTQEFIFKEGTHILTIKAIDFSDNSSVLSDPIILIIGKPSKDKEIILIPEEPKIETEKVIAEVVEEFEIKTEKIIKVAPKKDRIVLPLSSIIKVTEVIEAVEVFDMTIPEILEIGLIGSKDNIINFNGTSDPNKDIAIYIHSNQAIVYYTKSDDNGNWTVHHSQDTTELTAGDHSIFAVTVDPDNGIKSHRSEIKMFTIEKNLITTLFNLLNLETTAIALVIILITIYWLYRIKKNTIYSTS